MYIDLHTHSIASDGSCTPSEILDMAVEKNLTAVALTDHDTISGIEKFLQYASTLNSVIAVPGVEISVNFHGKEIHIVGLFIDYKHPPLLKLLKAIREERNNRNTAIILKLQYAGINIDMKEVRKVAQGESVGRPHFARVLVDKGYFENVAEVFEQCLGRGGIAYAPRNLLSPEEGITAIRDAGGLSIWAHPVYRGKGERSTVRKVLKNIVPLGLDGIECYYSTFTPKQRAMLIEVAGEFGLLQSGGSDFHGSNQPGIALGDGYGELKVPEELYYKLLEGRTAGRCPAI